jgi:hypothetical protein
MEERVERFEVQDKSGNFVTSYSAALEDKGLNPLQMAKDAAKYSEGSKVFRVYENGRSEIV